MTDKELIATHLEAVASNVRTSTAFNWQSLVIQLLPLVLQIVQSILAPQAPAPTPAKEVK